MSASLIVKFSIHKYFILLEDEWNVMLLSQELPSFCSDCLEIVANYKLNN
jgi:hypothetical protein